MSIEGRESTVIINHTPLRSTNTDDYVWTVFNNQGQWNCTTIPGSWSTYTFDFDYPGDIDRVVERFIWKPLCLEKKWRWLCKCYIKQFKRFPYNKSDSEWTDLEFLSYSEYLEWRILNE